MKTLSIIPFVLAVALAPFAIADLGSALQKCVNDCNGLHLGGCGKKPVGGSVAACVPAAQGFLPAPSSAPSAFIIGYEHNVESQEELSTIIVRTKNFMNLFEGQGVHTAFNHVLLKERSAQTALKADKWRDQGKLTPGFMLGAFRAYERFHQPIASSKLLTRMAFHEKTGLFARTSFDRDTHFLRMHEDVFKTTARWRVCTDIRTEFNRAIHRTKLAMAPVDDCLHANSVLDPLNPNFFKIV